MTSLDTTDKDTHCFSESQVGRLANVVMHGRQLLRPLFRAYVHRVAGILATG